MVGAADIPVNLIRLEIKPIVAIFNCKIGKDYPQPINIIEETEKICKRYCMEFPWQERSKEKKERDFEKTCF
jgi:hypothetical protein